MVHKVLFLLEKRPDQNLAVGKLNSQIPQQFEMASVKNGPSLLAVRDFAYSAEINVLAVDDKDILSVIGGEEDYWLIVKDPIAHDFQNDPATDFCEVCARISPKVENLAERLIRGLLSIDGSLDLSLKNSGRWVNSGVNFFTLKPQPRNKDIQFTLYGNPQMFDHRGFLKQDQNSYSRGWIKQPEDVDRFLEFAKQSYESRMS